MPLVPPASVATPEVAVVVDKGVSTAKDIMQPDAAGHLICRSPVIALFVTLKNIWSMFVLVLAYSVTGEQPTLAVVIVGPRNGVPMTPVVNGIPQIALTVPLVLQTYM